PLPAVGVSGPVDLVSLAVDIPGMVGDRVAQLQQRMLELTAFRGVDEHAFGVDALAELADEVRLGEELIEQARLRRGQCQPMERMVDEGERSAARHEGYDIDEPCA